MPVHDALAASRHELAALGLPDQSMWLLEKVQSYGACRTGSPVFFICSRRKKER